MVVFRCRDIGPPFGIPSSRLLLLAADYVVSILAIPLPAPLSHMAPGPLLEESNSAPAPPSVAPRPLRGASAPLPATFLNRSIEPTTDKRSIHRVKG